LASYRKVKGGLYTKHMISENEKFEQNLQNLFAIKKDYNIINWLAT